MFELAGIIILGTLAQWLAWQTNVIAVSLLSHFFPQKSTFDRPGKS